MQMLFNHGRAVEKLCGHETAGDDRIVHCDKGKGELSDVLIVNRSVSRVLLQFSSAKKRTAQLIRYHEDHVVCTHARNVFLGHVVVEHVNVLNPKMKLSKRCYSPP